MLTRRTMFLVVLGISAACSTSSSVVQVQVSSVVVSPNDTTVDVGLTVQFQAQALDSNGDPITGQTLTWASSQTSIATIDNLGVATGLAPGVTSITATIGGVSTSRVLTVVPNTCTGRVTVTLQPGESQSYTGDTCLLLPRGMAGDYYRVAVARVSESEDTTDVVTASLSSTPVVVTATATSPAPRVEMPASPFEWAMESRPRIDGTMIARGLERKARTRALHEQMWREAEELGMHRRELRTPVPPASGPLLADPPPRMDLFLDRDCSTGTPSPVIRVGFNNDLVIYQDSVEALTNPIGNTAATLALDYYTTHAKAMVAAYFGPPSDIDGNGRLIITTAGNLGGAAAAVWSGDFLSSGSCANSNGGEIMYFDVAVLLDLEAAQPDYFGLGVIAHEAKHVSSIYHSIARGAFHPTWIEEGTAEIAQVMSSRIAWASAGGPAVGARVTGGDISVLTPENWGAVLEMADVIAALTSHPNSLTMNPVGAAQFHSFYAPSWHWHRFLGDTYGNAATAQADSSFFRTLSDSMTVGGVPGLEGATGRTFDQLFEDIVVGVNAHMSAVAVPTELDTWDLVTATDVFSAPAHLNPDGLYPWPATTVGADLSLDFSTPFQVSGGMATGGVRFHDFESDGAVAAEILVTGVPSGRIIVTRIR